MNDCIFCSIVKEKIPSRIIFEDEKTLAFLSTQDEVEGHVLIIPKKHFSNLDDVAEEYFLAMQKTLLVINKHLLERCDYEGVNTLMASGETAGQSVNHLHLHVIPRKSGDEINAWPELDAKIKQTTNVLYEEMRIK